MSIKKQISYLAGVDPQLDSAFAAYNQKLEALKKPVEDLQNELLTLGAKKPAPHYAWHLKQVAHKLNAAVSAIEDAIGELNYHKENFEQESPEETPL
ncbi:MAG: hypothetical protein WC511_02190 [Candidatus Pacearchaeota archaeon]